MLWPRCLASDADGVAEVSRHGDTSKSPASAVLVMGLHAYTLRRWEGRPPSRHRGVVAGMQASHPDVVKQAAEKVSGGVASAKTGANLRPGKCRECL